MMNILGFTTIRETDLAALRERLKKLEAENAVLKADIERNAKLVHEDAVEEKISPTGKEAAKPAKRGRKPGKSFN